jgi:hypothetical protein
MAAPAAQDVMSSSANTAPAFKFRLAISYRAGSPLPSRRTFRRSAFLQHYMLRATLSRAAKLPYMHNKIVPR